MWLKPDPQYHEYPLAKARRQFLSIIALPLGLANG